MFMTPAEQVRIYFDERDRQYEANSKERRKAQADRIFRDPISLALLLSEAIDEQPMKFGGALQELANGNSLQLAMMVTTAVYESLEK